MKFGLWRNKKALSPVVASIILIAVTVAISIAVAGWTGCLKFSFMNFPVNIKDVAFSDNYVNQSQILSQMNITIISATNYKVENYIPYTNFTTFLTKITYFNISYVLTDYEDFEYPKYMDTNQLYYLGNYHIWFYIDISHIGKTAIVYVGTEYAWVNYPTLKGMASCFTEPIVRAALNPSVAMTVTHQPALSALLTHGNPQAFPKRVRVVPTLPLPIRNVLTKNISVSAFIPTLKDGGFPPLELKEK